MKLSKLNIESFRHLENLDFDFTYPKDYKDATKAGKPLNKICFIGQSATGKTGLLELIYEYNLYLLTLETVDGKALTNNHSESKNLFGEIDFVTNKTTFKIKNDNIQFDNRILNFENIGGSVSELISKNEKNSIIYFKSNLISEKNILIFNENPVDINEKFSEELKDLEHFFLKIDQLGIVFDDNVDFKIWLVLLKDILRYRKNFTQKMSEFIHQGLLANQNKLSVEFEKWEKNNPNTLKLFASEFDKILEKLNLEVDLVDTNSVVPIKNKKNEEIIPFEDTSTGTKCLFLTFFPLFQLNTKKSIILIDEPERSLYPDIQMELMEHYQNLAPEAQFIVATHSPFIAASFEPEERFILYFDEKRKVAVRRGSSPIGDDPNDMLYNDFGVNYYNKDVQKKFKQYIALLDKVKSENDKDLKKKYILEASKIGNQYNFILDEKNQERLK